MEELRRRLERPEKRVDDHLGPVRAVARPPVESRPAPLVPPPPPHQQLLPITATVAGRAASLRARHNIAVPDALHPATES